MMKLVAINALLLLLAFTACASEAPLTMQAAVVHDGGVRIQSVAKPVPGAGEVRIRVRAASVNPIDWKRAANFRPQTANSKMIPGVDAAGTVDAVGAGVSEWKTGDAVLALLDAPGAYAQYAIASADAMVRKPEKLSFEEAAGIPTVAYTAWSALIDTAKIRAGQRVLIHGGAGGVGSAAVQLAKARGAYVIATASSRNHEFLRTLGADETIDYRSQRFEDVVKGVDIALNTVDADTATRSVSVTKPGGIVVSVAGSADAAKCSAASVRCSLRSRDGTPVARVLQDIVDLALAGKYKVNVDATYPLANTAAAWDASRAGHTRGKRILLLP